MESAHTCFFLPTLSHPHSHTLTPSHMHTLSHSHPHTLTDTTDVQSVSVTPLSSNDSQRFLIVCQFAGGTRAKGCEIEIRNSGDVVVFSNQTDREDGKLVARASVGISLEPGQYTVRAYDVEANGTTTTGVFIGAEFSVEDNNAGGSSGE